VFDQLDFVYLPSRDAAADVARYERLGGECVFAIERFGTRVAMVRLTEGGPGLLLAEHLEGDAPILVFRVDSLTAVDEPGTQFEMPFGFGVELELPGPQRIAVYEATRRERGESLTGRRDF
jgi:hypothetical protein